MSYLVLAKTENALVSVLTTAVQAANSACVLVPAGSPNDKTLPIVICQADGSAFEEEPKATGNFWVQASVILKTKSAQDDSTTPDADRQALATAIEGVLMSGTLETAMTAAETDYTVFPGSIQFLSPKQDQQDDVWVDEFPMRVYCCASDLS